MFAVFSEKKKKMLTNDDGSKGFFPFQKGKHRTFLFFLISFRIASRSYEYWLKHKENEKGYRNAFLFEQCYGPTRTEAVIFALCSLMQKRKPLTERL